MKKASANLFEAAGLAEAAPRPLADRLRPATLDEVIGQDHLLASKAPPPDGQGGTALLGCVLGTARHRQNDRGAAARRMHRSAFRAALGDPYRCRRAPQGVRCGARRGARRGSGTLLFVDEIHRFNRAQQDAFLPHMEDGTIILVGATTENPSFELNSGAAVAGERADVQAARRRGARRSARARRGHRRASCRSTTRRARR